MIRVTKPAQAPAILRNRGRTATEALCAAYDLSPEEYANGLILFEFDSGLYGAKSVKNALRKVQHDKCAFCESRFTSTSYGDVEHYRPKAGYVQHDGDDLSRPGYYWLAYEWANLFFSCQICNQRFKRNLFPLKDPARRARSHQDSLDGEEPLLIDPGRDDPQLHLGFREEYVYAINGGQVGRATIEALGLNREEIVEQRRDYLRPLKLLREARDTLAAIPTAQRRPKQQNLLERIDAELAEYVKDQAPYTTMARAALR
jgi:uncharacterized protein (TIGR02646 family)